MFTPIISPTTPPTNGASDERRRTGVVKKDAPDPPRKKQRIVNIDPPGYVEHKEEQNYQKILKEGMTELIKMTKSIRHRQETQSAEIMVEIGKLKQRMERVENTNESSTSKIIDHQNALAKDSNHNLAETYKLILSSNAHHASRETPDHARTSPLVRIQQNRPAKNPKMQCIFCSKKNHKSADCRTIQFMAKRKLVLQRKGICFKCLQPGFEADIGFHPECSEPNKQCGNCSDYRDDGHWDHHEEICDLKL